MKSIKIVFASILVTIGVIVSSSFAFNRYDSTAFARLCYYYAGATNPPSKSDLLSTNNWFGGPLIPTGNNGEAPCPSYGKLCVICFDDAQFTGTSSQKLSQALVIVSNFEFANLTLDPQTIVANGKSVTVYQEE